MALYPTSLHAPIMERSLLLSRKIISCPKHLRLRHVELRSLSRMASTMLNSKLSALHWLVPKLQPGLSVLGVERSTQRARPSEWALASLQTITSMDRDQHSLTLFSSPPVLSTPRPCYKMVERYTGSEKLSVTAKRLVPSATVGFRLLPNHRKMIEIAFRCRVLETRN